MLRIERVENGQRSFNRSNHLYAFDSVRPGDRST